jgi:hypothetical protein
MVLHLPMRLLSTIRQRAAPAIDTTNSGSSSGGPGDGVGSSAAAAAAGEARRRVSAGVASRTLCWLFAGWREGRAGWLLHEL